MKKKMYVVKIGGNVIDDNEKLDRFLIDFAKLEELKILVHGGGRTATQLSKRLGITSQMLNGRRVTSAEELKIVVMTYAGFINKNICTKLQANNCNALGLSGVDANCISAIKRPSKPIDYGWVGDIANVNEQAIQFFLSGGFTPVFCAISHDDNGQLLNTNADTIAAEIAKAMSRIYEITLVYCFEKKGVLKDVNDDDSLIENIDTNSYEELKFKSIIAEGMLPKMTNCFNALNHGVHEVVISSNKWLGNKKGICTRVKK